jgi:hypothetical protein
MAASVSGVSEARGVGVDEGPGSGMASRWKLSRLKETSSIKGSAF